MMLCVTCYFLIILTSVIIYSKWKYSYWKNRNVFHFEPTFFYGNIKPVLKRTQPLSAIINNLYVEAKSKGEKYCGLYSFFTPQFVPIDLELLKCIFQKDFSYFTNHGFYVDEEKEPLSGHLFNLEDEKWRNLRAKLTPTFTSGKMKMMFHTMVSCTNGLKEALKESAAINDPVDIKDVLSRFTTDIIASVAFGLETNSLKNPDNEFRKYGKQIFQSTFRGRIIFTLIGLLPRSILKILPIKVFRKDMESFFINLVKETVEYREKNNIYRKDFMHLLIQLKNIGRVMDDSEEGALVSKANNNFRGMTINEMAAQVFVFFIAGFDTSATTMTFALLELSQNFELQEKLREEIVGVLKKYDNQITYEAIMEMELMEKIVCETLRKHPPLNIIPRQCTKDYKIANSDLVIKAGTRVQIPVLSVHRDPQYYKDPEKFDPERFNEENKASRPEFSYLPFGEGPRTCIGLRFGKLQAKVGLCSILQSYRVTLNDKTVQPIKYKNSFIAEVKDGVWLNLEAIE